jgi:hypothetical protein
MIRKQPCEQLLIELFLQTLQLGVTSKHIREECSLLFQELCKRARELVHELPLECRGKHLAWQIFQLEIRQSHLKLLQ